MVTISNNAPKKRRYPFGIGVKLMLSYVSILLVVLALINTYPLMISRDLVFVSKRTALEHQANQLGVALGALDTLSPSTVRSVINVLDTGGLARITVMNAQSDVLYQRTSRTPGTATIDSAALISKALSGNDVFRAKFTGGAFLSSASVPILSRGRLVGCVYISEYDEEEGSLILGLQSDIRLISAGLTVGTLLLVIVYTQTFRGRIRRVLDAIQSVREGEYSYRIHVRGHDELAQMSEEFNSLTTRLQETEETRRRFVADASHDLKTPLASIRLLSDSILQSDHMDPETITEFVSDIRNESERLARTTGQLLELTRLDNNISTIREGVDCAAVAEDVLRMLRPIAEAKSVELLMTAGMDCVVLSARDDIFTVIANLADNGVKYSEPGGSVLV
ncbi:MAG: sensor histidine kinase, partial [bacterium]